MDNRHSTPDGRDGKGLGPESRSGVSTAVEDGPSTVAVVEKIGWALAMTVADRLSDERRRDRYQGYWTNVSDDPDGLIAGARHLASMTVWSVDKAQGRPTKPAEPTGATNNGSRPHYPDLGEAMALVYFDGYDAKVQAFAVEVGEAQPTQTMARGALLAARECGVVYPRVATHVVHEKARTTDDPGLAVRFALLPGNLTVDELSILLDLTPDEIESLIQGDNAIRTVGHERSLTWEHRQEVSLQLPCQGRGPVDQP